jgi:hypothetical protein
LSPWAALASQHDAVPRRGEQGEHRGTVEFGLAGDGRSGLQVRGSVQRTGGTADGRDQRRRDKLQRVSGSRLDREIVELRQNGREPAVEVLAVIAVTDLPVEGDQFDPVLGDD